MPQHTADNQATAVGTGVDTRNHSSPNYHPQERVPGPNIPEDVEPRRRDSDRRQRPIPPRTVEPDHTLARHPSDTATPDLSAMVRQMVRESQGLTNDDWGISRSHTPFTDDILYAEPPRRFRMPALPMYEGNSDPSQHILKYEWSMTAARADDAVKCRSFPISLGEIATM